MAQENHEQAKASPEQIIYADILFYGSWLGIFIMLVTYVVYLVGILDPYVPLNDIPHYWSMPVTDYVREANIPIGWGWATLLSRGDFLNFIGIALLAFMTIVGYVSLIPAYIRQKDTPFTVLVILEILVLVLAASGILGVGGH